MKVSGFILRHPLLSLVCVFYIFIPFKVMVNIVSDCAGYKIPLSTTGNGMGIIMIVIVRKNKTDGPQLNIRSQGLVVGRNIDGF